MNKESKSENDVAKRQASNYCYVTKMLSLEKSPFWNIGKRINAHNLYNFYRRVQHKLQQILSHYRKLYLLLTLLIKLVFSSGMKYIYLNF